MTMTVEAINKVKTFSEFTMEDVCWLYGHFHEPEDPLTQFPGCLISIAYRGSHITSTEATQSHPVLLFFTSSHHLKYGSNTKFKVLLIPISLGDMKQETQINTLSL